MGLNIEVQNQLESAWTVKWKIQIGPKQQDIYNNVCKRKYIMNYINVMVQLCN